MKPKRKSIYKQFAFRVDAKKKKELMKEIDSVKDYLNSKLGREYQRLRKNDVIIDALERGLKLLRKRK